MSMKCEGLELLALPHLGIYDQQGYQIFTSKLAHEYIVSMPERLTTQIETIEQMNVPIKKVTIEHLAGFLDGYSDFVDLNIIFQPYVFFDAKFGKSHECTVNMAVYQDDLSFASAHLNNHTSDSVAINPEDILKCHLFISVHPDKDYMCISPNNGRIKVSCYVPLHVFYTLALVPYRGQIVRGIATKHVLVIGREKIMSLDWVHDFNFEENIDENFRFFEIFGGHPGIYWYMHNVLWRISGKPNERDFGGKTWERIRSRYRDDLRDKELLLRALETLVRDVKDWLRNCMISLEEIKLSR